MEMESFVMEDLLNFSVPEEEEEEEDDEEEVRPPARKKTARREKIHRSADSFGLIDPDDPELVEEEDLEWISNKDAFPVIETFVGVLPSEHLRLTSPEEAAAKQLSPVSVLETSSHSSASVTTTTTTNSSGSYNGSALAASAGATAIMSYRGGLSVPVKARSKRRRTGRRDLRGLWTHQEQAPARKKPASASAAAALGRKCTHCGSEKTPQWRAGPSGPKTLCNACGVRFKSGRLVPEYRPANSPTYSAELHSNSHRKILEMRKQQTSRSDVIAGDRQDCG